MHEWTVPAEPSEIPALRRRIVAFARAAGMAAGRVTDVGLAVTEAMANVVMHAYRAHAVPGLLHLRAERRDGHVEVTVSDDGLGLQPRHDSPGLGQGLPLIAELADDFALPQRESGTTVIMRFRLGPDSRREG